MTNAVTLYLDISLKHLVELHIGITRTFNVFGSPVYSDLSTEILDSPFFGPSAYTELWNRN